MRLPSVRIATIAATALLAACTGWWLLQLGAPVPPVAPAAPEAPPVATTDGTAASRLFGEPAGAAAAPVAAATDVRVLGVAASASGRGSAVLAVNGQPARAVEIGQEAAPGLKLLEVRADGVVLERGGARLTAQAPERSTTRVLTAGPQQGSASTVPPMAPAAGNMPPVYPVTPAVVPQPAVPPGGSPIMGGVPPGDQELRSPTPPPPPPAS